VFEDDPQFAPHYTHLAAGRLCFPYCTACARFHWYPMPLCPHCQRAGWEWWQVTGRGTLYSWTEIHHGFDARYAGPLPYIVALIDFADAPGVRLVSNIVGAATDTLTLDMSLTAHFGQDPHGQPRVTFRPL
jgi:uncharacterized protein